MPAFISVIVRLLIYAASMFGGAMVTSFIVDLFQKRKERRHKKRRTLEQLGTGR